MKAAVVYCSKTGFTRRYARWIADETGADCYELKQAKRINFDKYDAIVFGGWACAGSISGLKWFRANMDRWTGKKLIVFSVGASPADGPDIVTTLSKNLSQRELEQVKLFYCPGGLNYEKMSLGYRLMMRAFVSGMKRKKNKSSAEAQAAEVMSSSYDISDKAYIQGIVENLKD